jgi:hypothetical protein
VLSQGCPKLKASAMAKSPNLVILGRLENATRRRLGGGRGLELEREERSESKGGGRDRHPEQQPPSLPCEHHE